MGLNALFSYISMQELKKNMREVLREARATLLKCFFKMCLICNSIRRKVYYPLFAHTHTVDVACMHYNSIKHVHDARRKKSLKGACLEVVILVFDSRLYMFTASNGSFVISVSFQLRNCQ